MFKFDKKTGYIVSTLINQQHIFAGFGTKLSRPYKQIDIKKEYECEQIHGDSISEVTQDLLLLSEGADALMTTTYSSALKIRTADCVPIVYADHKHGVVGISHNGWRGTIKNLSSKMIQKMCLKGALIENIHIAIGPSIGPCCYEIFGQRFDLFKVAFPDLMLKVCVEGGLHMGLNLALLNYYQLLEAGVQKKNIDYACFCTSCDESRFYSYNRKNTQKRMFSFIVKYAYRR